MATRNVNLTDSLDRFVEERVRSGDFQNASEVVRHGLRLMKSELEEREQKIALLKSAVQSGLDDVAAGRVAEVEWDDLDGWLGELGRNRAAD